jgi:DNA-binding LytR/AlgR family response regulator
MNTPKLLKELSETQIAYLKASSNYTLIYTRKGEKLISGYSLNVFEELFAEKGFIRIDRSHLVHRSHIRSTNFSKTKAIVRLVDQQVLTVPRRKRKEFQKNFRLQNKKQLIEL